MRTSLTAHTFYHSTFLNCVYSLPPHKHRTTITSCHSSAFQVPIHFCPAMKISIYFIHDISNCVYIKHIERDTIYRGRWAGKIYWNRLIKSVFDCVEALWKWSISLNSLAIELWSGRCVFINMAVYFLSVCIYSHLCLVPLGKWHFSFIFVHCAERVLFAWWWWWWCWWCCCCCCFAVLLALFLINCNAFEMTLYTSRKVIKFSQFQTNNQLKWIDDIPVANQYYDCYVNNVFHQTRFGFCLSQRVRLLLVLLLLLLLFLQLSLCYC